MNDSSFLHHALFVVAAASLTTVLLRAFPFIAFGRSKETPPLIRYLGSVFSPAAIAMLSVYCIFSHWQSGLVLCGVPEVIAGAMVVALQLWKGNPLLSILSGTVIYMLLIQNF